MQTFQCVFSNVRGNLVTLNLFFQITELVLDESTINSFLSWTEKYQPTKARHVIGDKAKTKELFNWLCLWKEKHESIVKKMAARAARQ